MIINSIDDGCLRPPWCRHGRKSVIRFPLEWPKWEKVPVECVWMKEVCSMVIATVPCWLLLFTWETNMNNLRINAWACGEVYLCMPLCQRTCVERTCGHAGVLTMGTPYRWLSDERNWSAILEALPCQNIRWSEYDNDNEMQCPTVFPTVLSRAGFYLPMQCSETFSFYTSVHNQNNVLLCYYYLLCCYYYNELHVAGQSLSLGATVDNVIVPG